ncbi:hypothetical protein CPC08DRAFT_750365 [Agrocybe pediades]|nr:hypothetical protein CPC08DRAFT_750365 [Agrocybe pediades]
MHTSLLSLTLLSLSFTLLTHAAPVPAPQDILGGLLNGGLGEAGSILGGDGASNEGQGLAGEAGSIIDGIPVVGPILGGVLDGATGGLLGGLTGGILAEVPEVPEAEVKEGANVEGGAQGEAGVGL